MPLAPGTTLTHYEVLAPLGAGAMGAVWRARDTRLEREVALKVLPVELAGDEERLRRFEREARSLATLNHPNVAQVFDIDRVGDVCFMAMELVPGEDLAVRLARGPLALDDALDVARQVADGLEAAHEAGVVHRDLKPANVMLAPDGRVKVLDFGLAKAAGDGGGEDSALATEPGRLLGTPTYMAPEQARGRATDRRVDVWAFGCVLFECLTGRRAFAGDTVGEVLAAVLEREPDWSALPPGTPPPLAELVRACLRRDPRQRLRDLGDARVALEALLRGEGGVASAAVGPAQRSSLALPLVALVAAGAVALGWWGARRIGADAPPVRYRSVPLTWSNGYHIAPNWSPEGDSLVMGGMEESSIDLTLRHVASGEETVRRTGPGDDGAFAWSPYEDLIAFLATDLPGTPLLVTRPYGPYEERELVKTNLRVFDGASYGFALGDKPWARDPSTLLVSRADESGQIALWRVGVVESSQERLTDPPPGCDDLAGTYSFDGERIAFVRRRVVDAVVMLMDADGGEPEVLVPGGALIDEVAWLPDGERLIYHRIDGLQRDIWEVRLDDPASARPITAQLGTWVDGISVSASGRIAYSAGWHDTILTTLDLETGESVALTDHVGSNYGPRWSPDGTAIAYNSDRTGDNEVWVRGFDGIERRITRSPGEDVYPDWSPDGQQLVFVSGRNGAAELWIADRDGGNAHRLTGLPGIRTDSFGGGDSRSPRWSPRSEAGELVGFIVVDEAGSALWGVEPEGDGTPRKLFEGVVAFDWYLDCRRMVCTLDRGRAEELVAVDLSTDPPTVQPLWTGPQAELDVAPDGSAVMFCKGHGHLNMGLGTLALAPPSEPGGLPTAAGEPIDRVRPERLWHVHHGGWGPDSRSAVYVHDADRSNVYELVEER